MSIVRHLCATPGLSRADLASATGLTKSTVTLLVRELGDEGWLMEREVVATGDLGRRPTPLFIDPSRLFLVGGDVDIDGVRVVVTTLTGTVRARVHCAFGSARGVEACIALLANAMLEACKQLDAATQRVIGVGVGLPGGVDEVRGFLHFAPNLHWRDAPVGGLLAARLADSALADVPLYLQNDADVAVLGEMEFNLAQAADPLLYLNLNQGVGAGVIVGHQLLMGRRGFAGEVGHMVLRVGGPTCSCGRNGCAEALIGLRAMLPDTVADPLAEVRRRLAVGDADTRRAVKQAGNYLGVLLQNLAAAYDPQCIVLGGPAVELGDAFLKPALRTLSRHAELARLSPPAVRLSHFGADAVAVGAAALARYRLTRLFVAAHWCGSGPAGEQAA